MNHETFTLSQISQVTGISMPTLIKYKKEITETDGISWGAGRKMRFNFGALSWFKSRRAKSLPGGRPSKRKREALVARITKT